MKQHNSIQLFEDKKVRTLWDSDQEKWFISIIDVIEVLTGTGVFQAKCPFSVI